MRSDQVARHYARVLLEVAVAEGDDLDALAQNLDAFAQTVAGTPELAQALGSPATPRARRARLAASVAEHVASDASGLRLARFVAVMVERERAGEFAATARAYRAALDEHRGVVEAEVVSARPLDDAGREALTSALGAVLGGQSTRLAFREDPSLLGGFTVRAGNRIFDASTSGELDRFLAAHGAAGH